MKDQHNYELVTVLLVAFNHERFIEEAVGSILQQDYPNIEIILSDDCSADRTFEIMADMAASYTGPHSVVLNRNAENLGIIGHYNKLMKMAQGQLIIAAAGDDISEAYRVSRLVQEWKKGNAAVFGCNPIKIDEEGKFGPLFFERCLSHITWQKMVHISHSGIFLNAWTRDVFDRFGDLPRNTRNEDQIIPFRGALLKGAVMIDEPLIRYRQHSHNLSFWVKELSASPREWLAIRKRSHENHSANLANWQEALLQAKKMNLVSEKEYRAAWNTLQHRIERLNLEASLIGQSFLQRIKRSGEVWRVSRRMKIFLKMSGIIISPYLLYFMRRMEKFIKHNK